MKELEYPYDAKQIIHNRKALKRKLLENKSKEFLQKKIAILGGGTTRDIKLILELFLLNYGIQPTFYESEYNQYYEEGIFLNEKLKEFAPDLIYICTSNRNIDVYPMPADSTKIIDEKMLVVWEKFQGLWTHVKDTYHCPIIQNNFEYPFFRLFGNKDASDIHGRVNFISRLNMKFYEYAQTCQDFYICDINYLSASYGLDRWSDPYYWYMYKYAVAVPAIPYLAYNVACIVKSLYGKNKKVLNMDLDNTLWGGIIGDDGVNKIEIGQETPVAQAYSEFQEYIKLHKQLGILLTINSKNEEASAFAGMEHPDNILRPEDFISIKANWNPKSQNLLETADELELLQESFVFIDDNPTERGMIREQCYGVAVPEIGHIEQYIRVLDKSAFFETTSIGEEDSKRTEMYQENKKRDRLRISCMTYRDYLVSLEMKAEIQRFVPIHISRITQLINKSNQFNLTTKRYSQSEIESITDDAGYISLYGRLKDKFGDNGIVGVIIGRIAGKNAEELHLELWLMSCRVLKRNMEYAMMDELVENARMSGVKTLIGYYYPTAKNVMVKDFYKELGFINISKDQEGNTIWKFDITENYEKMQQVIDIYTL